MALIKSISGFRGTIGGVAGENLTPQDIVECTAAFGSLLLGEHSRPKVVVGRDARISGNMVKWLSINTLLAQGIDVVDLDLSTTPTVEMAVVWEGAQGGIILTASHNPKEWNALKFLNERGEFIAPETGQEILRRLAGDKFVYAPVDQLGSYTKKAEEYLDRHIEAIAAHPLVNPKAIAGCRFRIVVDGINSSGAIAVPALLARLGCETILLNGTPDGDFAHNPEPLPQHLTELSATVLREGAHLGIAVDPDVDRLALVCENGDMFGEEYTLVAVSDYVLKHRPGNTVSNLSSTRALRDVTEKHGGRYFASAVGEVNVVASMKSADAVIGGEGNGGVIVPDLHYGRDALAGIALFLTWLAEFRGTASALRATYPDYHMVKDRIDLKPGLDMGKILKSLEERFQSEQCNTIDGLKIDFPDSWVHLRQSNTEPIIRVYSEAPSEEAAKALVNRIKRAVFDLLEA